MVISMLLSPLSLVYHIIIVIKFKFKVVKKFPIPIISIGNLILGGTGKTPLTKAIFESFNLKLRIFIILRGYKRNSKGLKRVCINGKILCSIDECGDEAMEYAISLKNANVIVSEDREAGIKEAMNLGARLILLDDGFGKFNIFKFNILLKPEREPIINLTLPSGAYRYPKKFYKFADFIPSKDDIIKSTNIFNKTKFMVLVTAIANPIRLKEIFNHCINAEFFPDHYQFKKNELEKILKKHKATSLLVTMKDYVKIKDFNLPISIIILKTELSTKFKDQLHEFIKDYSEFC